MSPKQRLHQTEAKSGSLVGKDGSQEQEQRVRGNGAESQAHKRRMLLNTDKNPSWFKQSYPFPAKVKQTLFTFFPRKR